MSKNFLIIDDSKVSRMFIRRYIQEQQPDWQLFEAGNGEEALVLIEKQSFDAISVDYNMPGMNGLELATEIHARLPDCFIGLVTANIQKSTELATQQLGFHYYKKPVTESIIKQLVIDAENGNG